MERWRGVHWDPPGEAAWPFVILALALVAYAVFVYRRNEAPLTGAQRSLLTGLRAAALVCLVVILCRPVLSLAVPGGAARGVLVLLDRSESMNLPGFQDGETRDDELRRAVTAVQKQLGSSYPLRYRSFASALGDAVEPETLPPPTGDGTDLAQALEQGLLGGGDEGPPGAAVLITDGTATQGPDPVPLVRRMGIPVQTVGLGSPHPVPDLSLTRVRANIEAFAGERTPIEAVLRLQGLERASVTVQLLDVTEGEVEMATAAAKLEPGGAEQRVRMQFTPAQTGLRFLEVRVPPLPGESTPANNRRLVAIQVREEKTGVLILSGELTWDHTFLRRSLDSDSTLAVRAGVWRSGSFQAAPGAKGLPALTANGLRGIRVVVLDHVTPTQLGNGGMQVMAGFVRGGGGLVFITGSRTGSVAQWAGTPLETVFPMRAEGGSGRPEPEVQLRLTAAAARHALFDPAVPGAPALSAWTDLPPLAVALDAGPVRGTGEALLVTTGGVNRPVLAWMRSGQGRVLALAAGGMWRWDFMRASHSPQGNIIPSWWRRAAHWLSLPGLENRVDIHPEDFVVARGQAVTFVARVTDERYEPLSGVTVLVTLSPSAGSGLEPRTLTLRGGDGFYSGVVETLAPGRYRYQGRAQNESGVLGTVDGVVAVDSLGTEMERLEADHEVLERIATVSGGSFWMPDSLNGLSRTFGTLAQKEEERVQLALWDHPLLFALFVVFASLEWFLRRRRGLI
jgi:hypothetical protein